MKKIAMVFMITALFLIGCEYEAPLDKEHDIPIDTSVLGLWEYIPENGEKSDSDERVMILKYSETEYLIHYFWGKHGIYYRGYPMRIGEISCVQLQVIGDEDGVPKKDDKTLFHVVSYRLEGGGLVVSVLNTELVEKSLKDSEALRKAFLKNKMNKALFTNPGRFRRAAEIFDPSDETTEASTTDQSYLSRLWNPDGSKKHSRFVLKLHRSNYILPYSYNFRPNEEPFDEAVSDENLRNTEVKFQLSFKIRLLPQLFGYPVDLWFGYTQQSFWQLYNFEDSAPFRETNYEPELLLNFRTEFEIPKLGLTNRYINFGINHQSNGRSEPFSRSWNRVVMNIGFEKGNFVLLLKPWFRIPESETDDNNPHIDDYVGYGEIWGYYFWKQQRFGLMLRNNLKTHDNRGCLQLEYAFPISLLNNLNAYIQYFSGYGESLLDYDHSVDRIGVGLILRDWDFTKDTVSRK